MRIAIVGSRSLSFDSFQDYVKQGDEIITGGASGIDICAIKYAESENIPCTIIKPDYKKYGKCAPIIRNKEIVSIAERIVAVWDGKSKGTLSVIRYAEKIGKPLEVIFIDKI